MQTGKESFRRAMLLIAFGVILFAAVTHLQDLWMGFMGLMGLFSPILLVGAFALILNVPVRGFERIFARLDRRNHLKPGTRNMLGLTLTLLVDALSLVGLVQTLRGLQTPLPLIWRITKSFHPFT